MYTVFVCLQDSLKQLVLESIDNNNAPLTIFYDSDINLVYLVGKVSDAFYREFPCFGLAAILEVTLNSVQVILSWKACYMFVAFQGRGFYWFGVIHLIELNGYSWVQTVLQTLLLYLQDGR